ncbi:hypothetical protein GDO81_020389 [Engystomops pustulosus]|uniref:Uncharacterized protein n=1 Tax=Engystomops pustulosus TaxID=76066 RepID=A0AAV6YVC0_ENGPU|nr:hypothetical protein GDO81_020389 [Engystomops pustulosus]
MKSGKLDVVVTSRAAECNALWIINHLRSQVYRDLLGRVTYLPITNRNQEEWSCEVQNHSFSILYHSKHQGRINLTDVTDSLYDLELQELSKTLGRGNVMVVVDDLQKSDEEEKQRILKNQPSISRWASQLLLFAENEKNPISTQKQQVLLQTFQTEEGHTCGGNRMFDIFCSQKIVQEERNLLDVTTGGPAGTYHTRQSLGNLSK